MKKPYIFLLLFLSLFTNVSFAQCDDISLENLTNPGPYEVKTLTEEDGIRNGPEYSGATIYYPTNTISLLPSIAIVPGWGASPSSVEEWGPFYASHGIVTIIIGTNNLYTDLVDARAQALLDALETVKQENSRESSPLKDILNLNKMAVSGWSMGGGGAQRAATLDSTINAVVALCPYLFGSNLNHQSPLLIFSGEDDPTAPPEEHADVHYKETPDTTDKLLVEIANGDHSVANTPNGGEGIVGKIALSWLKLYLEDNTCYCPLLKDELLLESSITSKIEQSFECESLSLTDNKYITGFYPNPAKNIVTFKVLENVDFELFSLLGQSVLKGKLTINNNQIDVSNLPENIYLLKIKNQTIKLVKQN
ncbi:poly(ethylene terephthalate) hydrolase family protein [Polaribacter sargassicola]|uniref:T9SS type A sorting domain-containing protein n=1 Tax=Polaribacter sargassicola TaxID=2836891 RepID=UPI001F295556|nr:T9SS type A sorting domain-containing protein [Polaribacter sp. DS7-9]MCG1037599.1 T9SS type A sorting domain-containing protein [Polaribacter sp. DS7-9]